MKAISKKGMSTVLDPFPYSLLVSKSDIWIKHQADSRLWLRFSIEFFDATPIHPHDPD